MHEDTSLYRTLYQVPKVSTIVGFHRIKLQNLLSRFYFTEGNNACMRPRVAYIPNIPQ